jgi:hypothetical protein
MVDFGLIDMFKLSLNHPTDYLNYEAWPKSRLSPSGFFYNSTYNNTGDLESTYFAIASQKLLIDQDFGQTINTYYDSSSKLSILNYIRPFIVSTESYWYGQAAGLNNLQTTWYLKNILEILGLSSEIDYIKLSRYINSTIINSLSLKELNWYIQFISSNSTFSTLLENLMNPNQFCSNETILLQDIRLYNMINLEICKYCLRLYSLDKHFVFVTYPETMEIGISSPFRIQLSNCWTTESISNILLGETYCYSQWIKDSLGYATPVVCEFDMNQLDSWMPTWSFTHDNIPCSFSLDISLIYHFDDYLIIKITNKTATINILFDTVSDIYSKITSEVNLLDTSITCPELSADFTTNQINYSLGLDLDKIPIGAYVLQILFYNVPPNVQNNTIGDALEYRIPIEGKYVPYEPPIINTTILSNNTSNSTDFNNTISNSNSSFYKNETIYDNNKTLSPFQLNIKSFSMICVCLAGGVAVFVDLTKINALKLKRKGLLS